MGEKRSTTRKERVPLTGLRQKLHVSERYKEPGFVYHWFNDTRSKLEDAQNAWWSFVEDPDMTVGETGDGKDQMSTKIRRIVGTDENGRPKYAYLMKIQKRFYEEDMAERNKHLDAIDNAIRRGANVGGEPGQDGKYIPAQGIKYEHKLE